MASLFSAVPVLPFAPAAYMLFFFVGAFLVLRGWRKDSGASRREAKSYFGIALQGLGFFIAGFGPVNPSGTWSEPLAVLLFLGAAASGFAANWLFIAARRAMGANWSIVARTRADHELVTSGPFARVRHPIYLALLIYVIGLAFSLGHVANLLAAIPIYLAGTFHRTRIEERLLRDQFGPAFDDYRRSVPAILPRL